MAADYIKVGGAREHNLKNLTLTIPRNKLVVITGLSGSGKSSLAFDTIYAEGQRKYVESLSSYARQFLDQMQKPDVDYIEGISPTIAIEQRGSGGSPRSIIATTTEIFDYLRLLFAHIGRRHCPDSGQSMSRQTPTEITDKICALPPSTRTMILAPVINHQKGEFRDVFEKLAREGFVRARVDGELVELAANTRVKLDPKKKHDIEAVVDRLVIGQGIRQRLSDSIETALKWGQGQLRLLHQPPGVRTDSEWAETLHSTHMYSVATGKSYDVFTPKHFSFNSPQGACSTCHGLGQKLVFDPDLIVPNPEKTLAQGAIAPWKRGGRRLIIYYNALIRAVAAQFGQSLELPYAKLPESFRKILMEGSGEELVEFGFWRAGKLSKSQKPFEGVLANLERLYTTSESEFTKNRIASYMSPQPCDGCEGRRLKREILAVTLHGEHSATENGAVTKRAPGKKSARAVIPGKSIMDLCAMSVDDAHTFIQAMPLSNFEQKVAGEIVKEILARLGFLKNVGLGYLTLDRESGTLSGGEAQRIRLATQIGAGLVGVIYILDEPSIGLHQRDNDRLLGTLKGLRDLGNTVIVVEHDEDTIRQADYLLDLGPGAGVNGGELVSAGTVEEVAQSPRSITGRYLRGELAIDRPGKRLSSSDYMGWVEIIGASENNLKNIDVRIPLGTLTCVTGVSGSGKSTLVDEVLRKALLRKFYGAKERPGKHRAIEGVDHLTKAIVIDQSPIGRTPRSNPATYTGMFNEVRDLFARLPTAKVRGYGPGRFSFNVKGGRCEKCEGNGTIKIEMHFLPAVYVTCEDCVGRRYNRETLEIHYKGINIADVLQLTVDEAVNFFRAIPKIYNPCITLAEVGLGYLQLGQAATTLSGGEAQRVKLSSELCRRSIGHTMYILDEPTTGLHFHDVAKLLEVFFRLRDAGNTLVVIEHNLDVIKCADWIVDLGPEGGLLGGHLVAEGTPETVAANPQSHTGKFLSRMLKR